MQDTPPSAPLRERAAKIVIEGPGPSVSCAVAFLMPSSASPAAAISSTAATGSPEGSGVDVSGSALVIRTIVPSVRMKTMSSGMSVFFIQKATSCAGS